MSTRKKFWYFQWPSKTIVVSVLASVSCMLLLILYTIYSLMKNKLVLAIISYFYGLILPNEWAKVLYKEFKPEIGRHFKKQGNFLQPFSFWTSAPPEENYEMLKKLGLQVIVKGAEKIPKSGGLVVISNHTTAADPSILIHIFNEARGDQLATCLMGIWSEFGPELAHPNKLFLVKEKHMVPEGFNKIRNVLEDGRVFIIFPSGSLGDQEFKSGALRIALDNQVPILPVKIHFKLDWWTEIVRWVDPEMLNSILMGRSFGLYQKNIMQVTIGDPIPYEELETYKERMINTKNGKRFHPKVMKELRKRVESIR